MENSPCFQDDGCAFIGLKTTFLVVGKILRNIVHRIIIGLVYSYVKLHVIDFPILVESWNFSQRIILSETSRGLKLLQMLAGNSVENIFYKYDFGASSAILKDKII